MRESTEVNLVISSTTVTAAQIEAALGMKPDDAWKTGEPRGAFSAPQKAHGYLLEGKAPIMASLEDHIRAMIKRVAPVAQKIGELSAQCTVVMQCRIFRKTAPSIYLTRDDLRWLAALGAKLDIDAAVVMEPPKPAAGAKPGDGKTT
jgi:hypothetical protein